QILREPDNLPSCIDGKGKRAALVQHVECRHGPIRLSQEPYDIQAVWVRKVVASCLACRVDGSDFRRYRAKSKHRGRPIGTSDKAKSIEVTLDGPSNGNARSVDCGGEDLQCGWWKDVTERSLLDSDEARLNRPSSRRQLIRHIIADNQSRVDCEWMGLKP